MLIKGETIQEKNAFILRAKSDGILKFLGEHSEEVDNMIKKRAGYIGPRKVSD
jgi:hypothetical protein